MLFYINEKAIIESINEDGAACYFVPLLYRYLFGMIYCQLKWMAYLAHVTTNWKFNKRLSYNFVKHEIYNWESLFQNDYPMIYVSFFVRF